MESCFSHNLFSRLSHGTQATSSRARQLSAIAGRAIKVPQTHMLHAALHGINATQGRGLSHSWQTTAVWGRRHATTRCRVSARQKHKDCDAVPGGRRRGLRRSVYQEGVRAHRLLQGARGVPITIHASLRLPSGVISRSKTARPSSVGLNRDFGPKHRLYDSLPMPMRVLAQKYVVCPGCSWVYALLVNGARQVHRDTGLGQGPSVSFGAGAHALCAEAAQSVQVVV